MFSRRGFSLLEVIVTVALIALIFALIVPQLGGSGRGGDEQARFGVSAGLEAEVAYFQEHGVWAVAADLDGTRLAHLEAVASPVPSGDASTISIRVEAGEVGIAAAGTATCWVAHIEGTQTLWGTTTGACTGAQAIALAPPESDPSRGSSPDRPIVCGQTCP